MDAGSPEAQHQPPSAASGTGVPSADVPGKRDGPRNSFLGLVRDKSLSPVQRRIAQYVINNEHEVLFHTSAELSRRAGVSQPSVIRFAQALGFSGYSALQEHLRRHFSASGGHGAELQQNKFERAVLQEEQNLEELRRALGNDGRLQEIGKTCAAADRLVVLGLRQSAPLADYFTYYCSKIHPSVVAVTASGSRVFDELLQLADATTKHVICFAMPLHPTELPEALDYAARLGYQRTLITTTEVSSLASHAESSIAAPAADALGFNTHAAAFVLAGLLVEAVVDGAPERSQRRLEAIEMLASERGTFSELP